MILYVNGDSHTAAAEAVNPYAFAEDDPDLSHLGRLPHPANLISSWGRRLADSLKFAFKCDAESAASNQRIMRTTRAWLDQNQTDVLVILQWSTWEREEWIIDGIHYQVNASGIDHVPVSHQQQYKEFVANIDWDQKTRQAHDDIWQFHLELQDLQVPHVFFNGNNHFGHIHKHQKHDWGTAYIGPYDPKMTFNQWLLDRDFVTVSPKSYHFGKEAHGAWARFVLQYVIDNKLI